MRPRPLRRQGSEEGSLSLPQVESISTSFSVKVTTATATADKKADDEQRLSVSGIPPMRSAAQLCGRAALRGH